MRVIRLLLAGALAAIPAAAATLIADYQFNGNLNSSLAGPPALVSGGGTVNATTYSFLAGQGLSLANGVLANNGDYSIAMRFQFADTNGYRKILDFKNLTADTGFYNLNTAANFYNVVGGPAGAFSLNTYADVVLTRDAASNIVTAYVNGVQHLTFADTGFLGVFNPGIMYFFKDDNATSGTEASAGIVDRIEIFNGALSGGEAAALNLAGASTGVPEPITFVLTGAGIAAFGLRSRKCRQYGKTSLLPFSR